MQAVMTSAGAASQGPERATVVLIGGILAIGVALCIPSMLGLSYLWGGSQFYGHAYALPVVAVFLAYGGRYRIARVLRSLDPPRYGAWIALGAGCFEVLMYIGDVGFAAGLGIPVVLGAAAYGIGGLRLLRPLAFPLGFLALMVPPPRFLMYQLLYRLKLIVTDTAVALMQALGQPVMAEGNQIVVPGHTLFVADACSGLTSIVTLLPLSCIVAYFLSRGIWRRAVVVASVFPLAIAANILRVVVTVQMVSSIGIEAAQGSLHESFGVFTYVLGTLSVIGVARLLR